MVILDTNVVSELMDAEPNATVINWLDRQSWSSLWTTSVTVMEVRYGLAIMPPDAGEVSERRRLRG